MLPSNGQIFQRDEPPEGPSIADQSVGRLRISGMYARAELLHRHFRTSNDCGPGAIGVVQSVSSMPDDSITLLLHRWRSGDVEALDHLLPKVYADLRALARSQLRGNRGSTLQPTALVHDMLLRFMQGSKVSLNDSAHFFKAAARTMRNLLADRARRAQTDKHGGGYQRTDLLDVLQLPVPAETDLELLDAALTDLETIKPDLARIVELRYFVGLKVHEVAALLGVDESTVYRDWAFARAWLRERMRP
ncbi:ECF-type sigma factor [Dokdonella sp.]|uniref:ECF-type sigma factor n=1 Tax=Dokdonella sp. TaxID=2291710 RepID=UPI001B2E5B44|nr:ECF-type sigma factor [Dokdonella sp.]MBO9663306.1 sigma-70 family RNA polymerase sigma factor [Dokdonella sp.]